jgi:hypothetical protein
VSRRKPFWHVAPQYYVGVLTGSVATAATILAVWMWL